MAYALKTRSLARHRNLLLIGLLLACLVVFLLAYPVVVQVLPTQVYTPSQQAFLEYNRGKSISQEAVTWNLVLDEGQIVPTVFPGQRSRVRATLVARYEEYERVSVTVYDLEFHGEYTLAHLDALSTRIQLFFPFPSNLETLHDVRFLVDGEEPPTAAFSPQGISWETELHPGQEHKIEISYRADGATSFAYGLYHGERSDVDIAISVLGLVGSEVPRASLPTTSIEPADDGEVLTWDYQGLIADRDIQITLPSQMSFAQHVAEFDDEFHDVSAIAPVLVGLFLVSMFGIFRLGGVRVRAESYLLAGCGLALFYPALSFLSGLVDVIPAAIVALVLVSALLMAFLGRTVGWRETWWRLGLLLIIFPGLASLGLLTPWREIFLTGAGLLLVATFMLVYARRPAEPEPEAEPDPPAEPNDPGPQPFPTAGVAVLEEDAPPEEVPSPAEEPDPEPAGFHCPYCARQLDADFGFCPSCGHDTNRLYHCAACGGEQFVPADQQVAYCLRCGEQLV